MTLQDPQTAVVRFDPAKSFGGSAFGPLRLQPVDGRGVQGDWISLATLVRVPVVTGLDCPDDTQSTAGPGNRSADPVTSQPNNQPTTQVCTLKGTNLFLLDAISADSQFTNAASVPEGFIGDTLPVPHPVDGLLYLKLRDEPSDVNTVSFPGFSQNQTSRQAQSTTGMSSPVNPAASIVPQGPAPKGPGTRPQSTSLPQSQ